MKELNYITDNGNSPLKNHMVEINIVETLKGERGAGRQGWEGVPRNAVLSP